MNRRAWWPLQRPRTLEIGVRLREIDLLDPRVSEPHVVPFALQLQRSGLVRDPLTAVVAAVEPGVCATPDLIDLNVGVRLFTVEVDSDHRLLHALAVLEPCGAEVD